MQLCGSLDNLVIIQINHFDFEFKGDPAAKTSRTMLNSSGESGHPCLVPDFSRNAFNFSPLRIMFAVGLS